MKRKKALSSFFSLLLGCMMLQPPAIIQAQEDPIQSEEEGSPEENPVLEDSEVSEEDSKEGIQEEPEKEKEEPDEQPELFSEESGSQRLDGQDEKEIQDVSPYSPHPNIQYGYSAGVSAGTIRYINQVCENSANGQPAGPYFNWAYWPPLGSLKDYAWPRNECQTACISMALSYVGISKTPAEILKPYNGQTVKYGWAPVKSSYDFAALFQQYEQGNGKYSPVVVHSRAYSEAGHYFLVIGRISGNTYQVLDPYNLTLKQVTISGRHLDYVKSGQHISEDTDQEFYQYYNSGAVKGNNPEGCFDGAEGGAGRFHVSGWAFDRDNPAQALDVHVYIGGPAGSGARGVSIPANTYRNDVDQVHHMGANHGFSSWIDCDPGTYDIYIYAINIGGGTTNPLLGKKTVTVLPRTVPVIYDVRLDAVSSQEYTLSCRIKGESISQVRFPSWSVQNGQDDLLAGWDSDPKALGTLKNGRWTFTVQTADHLNDQGLYFTHIYAYDSNGTSAKYSVLVSTISDWQHAGMREMARKESGDTLYVLMTPELDGATSQWSEAEIWCQSVGGHLASISSAEENAVIASMAAASGMERIWIGGNDLENEGTFVWTDGKPFSYTNFESVQPDNYLNGQHGLSMYQNGRWDDASIGNHFAFVLKLEHYCRHEYQETILPATCLDNQTIRKTCRLCGHTEDLQAPDAWSEWSTQTPDSDEKNRIEEKTQYRSRTTETIESADPDLKNFISRTPFTHYSDWGAWSAWSWDSVSASDIRMTQSASLYRYYYFLCPVCGRHEPFTGISDCHQYTLSQNNAHEGWFETPYAASSPQRYSYTSAKFYTNSLGDGQVWNFSAGNLNDTAPGTVDAGSSAVVIRTGYRYRTRTRTQMYRYERWKDWSSWSDTPVSPSSKVQVETRTVWRVNSAPKGEHAWNEGTIVIEPDFGKEGLRRQECSVCHSIREEKIPVKEGMDLSRARIVTEQKRLVYNQRPQQPAVAVYWNDEKLAEEKDYALEYRNNIEPGQMEIRITGKGRAYGSASVFCTIEKAPLTLICSGYENGSTITLTEGQEKNLSCGFKESMEGMPAIEYSSSNPSSFSISKDGVIKAHSAGSGTLTIRTEENEHFLEAVLTLQIVVKEKEPQSIALSDCTIRLTEETQIFSGAECTPQVEVRAPDGSLLILDSDYSLRYSSNLHAGQAFVQVSGMGRVNGSRLLSFVIQPALMESCTVVSLPMETFYTGSPITFPVMVFCHSLQLKEGEDYTLAWSSNLHAGQAKLTVQGKNDFAGTLSRTFLIRPVSIAQAQIQGLSETYEYDGNPVFPQIRLDWNGKKLEQDRDYVLELQNNEKPGEATVIISGRGNFSGKTERNFKIVKIAEDLVKGVEMHRLYNPNSGEHFYTASSAEKNALVRTGWKYEGTAWKAPVSSSVPVYRLYNRNAGDHHYTMDLSERNFLISIGWKDEGIGWYSDEARGMPLYRQYNPNAKAGSHNYTASKAENDFLVSVGWKAEGVGWYGIRE